MSNHRDAALVRTAARTIESNADLDPLVEIAGAAQVVLIGEASHGTREFYEMRAEVTKRLIERHGFVAVAWEADWPDTNRVHRYVVGRGNDQDAESALGDFHRFPAWMWRNRVVREFIEWLHRRNRGHAVPAGVYGIDLYSMHTSIEAVLKYLDKADPEAAARARARYGCFEHFSQDPQVYGVATTYRGKEPCEAEVVDQLVELRRKYHELIRRDGHVAEEEFFSAEQNARLVMNAERYYRSMFYGRDESWNLRDTHMFETLLELREHLGNGGKLVVWAHNSHLGDARATEVSRRGELNVGQLVRERFGKDSFSIGFSTYTGTVTAAHEWGEPAQHKRVLHGLPDSYEALFHEVGIPNFWLALRDENKATKALREARLQRAIGVIYRPETERWSHYFEAELPSQFDAMIHLDHTHALEPLDRTSDWDPGELPETYPSAL